MPGKHNARPCAPRRGAVRGHPRLVAGIVVPVALLVLAAVWATTGHSAPPGTAGLFVRPSTPPTTGDPITGDPTTGDPTTGDLAIGTSSGGRTPAGAVAPDATPTPTRFPARTATPGPGGPDRARSGRSPSGSQSTSGAFAARGGGADPGPGHTRAAPVTASYVLTSTQHKGFVAAVTLHNPRSAGASWRVELTYPAAAKVTVTGAWNATATSDGTRLVFAGTPLAAGASHLFGFQAAKAVAGQVSPTSCTVNGVPCAGF